MALKAWYLMWSESFDIYMYGMCWKVNIIILKGLCLNEVCIWYVKYDNVWIMSNMSLSMSRSQCYE